MPHYHIRWSSTEVLDWEAFPSRAEAQASAAQLVRFDETYHIEESDEYCPRCLQSFKLKRADFDFNRTYPWQQAVLDALNESNAEQRIRKINAAQLAICARIPDIDPITMDEGAAIRSALGALRQLLQTQPNLKYPEWQRLVLDAVTESDRHESIDKIRIAEVAILQQLKQSHSLSPSEKQALQDSLRSLEVLMTPPDSKRARTGNSKIA